MTVVATDADGMMSEQAVTVEVTNEDEDGTVTLDAVAPYPGVALTATDSDPDGVLSGTQEWQWSKSMSKSGSYTDIEDADEAAYTPTDGDVGYYLRATVAYDDGEGDGKSAIETSAHEVQSINSPNADPAFPDQDPDMTGVQNTEATRMVGENTDAGENVGDPVPAEDANSDILTYTLGGDAASSFEIDAATGQITVGADTELDFETTTNYDVTVTATDPAGADAAITVTINVVDDENEPPAITGTVPDNFNEGTEAAPLTGQDLRVVEFMAEDPDPIANNPTITWSLSGEDAGDFTITGGDLTFRVSPNYEMPADADGDNVYKVTVSATDDDRNRGEKDVEVKVANVDEPGTVTLSTVQPRVGVPLTASLTDIDVGVTGVTWQWYDGTINTSDLTQNAIDDATSDTYTPTADDLNDTLTARASYTDAQGPEKAAAGPSVNSVAADTRNKAPAFPDQDAEMEGTQNTETEREIAENSDAGTSLNGGGPVTATDSNANDILTYTLGGPDASSFDIDSASGQITVGTGTELDFETKPSYMVTVIATDSFDASASIDVTITVTDVNEGPMIMRGGLALPVTSPMFNEDLATEISVAEDTAMGGNVGAPFTATDADGDTPVYALSGADAAAFAIDGGTGQITVGATLDYETTMSYTVTVEVRDNEDDTGAADTIVDDTVEVTITVTNVDEDGTVTLSAETQVGVAINASVTDPDGSVTGTTWQWASSATADGAYTDIPGAMSDSYTPVAGDEGNFLRATASYTDAEGSGKNAKVVSDNAVVPASGQVFNAYDADKDGAISGPEVIKAVKDYFAGSITGPEVIAVVKLYFASR